MSIHRKKILFISARLPFPPTEGHQIRTFGILKQLQKNNDIHLLSVLRPNEEVPKNNELSDLCSSIEGVKVRLSFSSNITALIKSAIKNLPIVVTKYINSELEKTFQQVIKDVQPDIVHFDLLHLVQLSKYVPAETTIVLNQHNVESDLVFQRAKNTQNIILKMILNRDAKLLRAFEENAVRLVSVTLSCSDADRNSLLSMGANQVHTIPNGVDTKVLTPGLGMNNEHFVFLGGMGWYPNKQGMEWFINKVMPILILSNDTIQIDIIGNPNPILNVPEVYEKNINIIGFVDDFKPLVRNSLAMIVPLTVGSGTRLKVLEGMSLGKSIVSTKKGAQGIELDDGIDILFADKEEEFSKVMLDLIENKERAADIGKNARAKAVSKYDWDVIGESLNTIYSEMS